MDFAFVVTVWQDQHLAQRLLSQIKQHCPDKTTIVIGDGVKLEDYCKDGTIWIESDRAKAQGQKGLWTQRFLELFLKYSNAEYVIKVDPDTCVWRPFTLPEGDYDLCGNIKRGRYKYPYIRGGCVVISRSAAEKIINSGYLLDDKYAEYNYSRYKLHKWSHEKESEELIAFQDWIVGDIIHRLDLKLQEWSDIYIIRKKAFIRTEKFAITHPHPTLEEVKTVKPMGKAISNPQKDEEVDVLVDQLLKVFRKN